ncbi:MAG: NUDIX domain-containing protein [Candidatus Pacebacteria bacterium]|nr:NUDIX domain-containing protein [Candidatus Paceibacterota bacterium]
MNIQNRELHRIVASAIIIKDGKYLITKRSPHKKAFANMWTVPGGGIEVDDYINAPKSNSDCWYFALEKALRREVMEEVGVEIGRVKYLLDLAFIRPDNIPVITLSFYCDWQSGEVKLNEENVDFRWVTFEEAKNYEFCPGLLGEIEMVDKILRGEDPDNIIYNPNI